MTSCNLAIGPSGWDHPHWEGVVYPKQRPPGFHPLSFLPRWFRLIEIASTFHRPARPEIARLWLAKARHHPEFTFTALLNRRFTHERALDPAEVASFKEGLLPLVRAGRFGCLVMQFPWSFRFTAENREHLIRLRRAFHEFPMAVEMRHESWLLEEALGTLIDYRLGFVNVDQPLYTRAMPPTAFVTSSVAYVRLHGRNSAYWQHEFGGCAASAHRHGYLYSPGELEEWKGRIEHVARHAARTFVVLTNDADGNSVVNAMQLGALLAQGPVHNGQPHTAAA